MYRSVYLGDGEVRAEENEPGEQRLDFSTDFIIIVLGCELVAPRQLPQNRVA